MPFDMSSILLIFGCVIFGFISGAAITYWWSQREKRAYPHELQRIKKEEPAQEIEKPAPLPPPPARPALAQLWRDENGSQLLVEMEGRSYHKAAELAPEKRVQMVEVLREWVAWLGFSLPSQPSKETAQTPVAAPIPVPAPPPVSVSAATPVSSNPAQVSAAKPVASVPAAEAEKKIPLRVKSMVEQVDDILQEMQADLPEKTPRIKLVENMQHGIVAWIGLEHYAGIENIPNEEGRQLVRRAVAEWERRAG